MATAQAKTDGTRKTRVFISYSRKDRDFAQRLHSSLGKAGFEPLMDMTDIAPGDDWREAIAKLILQADAIAFCASSHSAVSQECRWELDESDRLSKRLLPVVVDYVEPGLFPDFVSKLNFVFFIDTTFEQGFEKFRTALETDLDWQRQHTRVAEQADEWEDRKRANTRLLTGQRLTEAEAWLSRQPKDAPTPSPSQLQFIAASRSAANFRQRLGLIGAIAVAAISFGLFLWGNNARIAADAAKLRAEAAEKQAQNVAKLAQDSAFNLAKTTREKLNRLQNVPPAFVEEVLKSSYDLADNIIAAGARTPENEEMRLIMLNTLADSILWNGDTGRALKLAEHGENLADQFVKTSASDAQSINMALIEQFRALKFSGTVLTVRGKIDEAISKTEKSLQLAQVAAKADINENFMKHEILGILTSLSEQYRKARRDRDNEAISRERVEIAESLKDDDPDSQRANKSATAAAYHDLGRLLCCVGHPPAKQIEEGVAFLRRSFQMGGELTEQDGDNDYVQSIRLASTTNIARGLHELAKQKLALGAAGKDEAAKLDEESEGTFKAAHEFSLEVLRIKSDSKYWQWAGAVTGGFLSEFYVDVGRAPEAVQLVLDDLPILKSQAEAHPDNASMKSELAIGHYQHANSGIDPPENLQAAQRLFKEMADAGTFFKELEEYRDKVNARLASLNAQ